MNDRWIVLSGGPFNGAVHDLPSRPPLRMRFPADTAVWRPSCGYGTAEPLEHIYVREDGVKTYAPCAMPVTYRYEGTR